MLRLHFSLRSLIITVALLGIALGSWVEFSWLMERSRRHYNLALEAEQRERRWLELIPMHERQVRHYEELIASRPAAFAKVADPERRAALLQDDLQSLEQKLAEERGQVRSHRETAAIYAEIKVAARRVASRPWLPMKYPVENPTFYMSRTY